MRVETSSIRSVDLIGPEHGEFADAVSWLLGRKPDDLLTPALPYSVIARNNDSRVLALLGVRFDMLGRKRNPWSVIHYADTLRNPERADLKPGMMRFVCAEPLYTDLVLRRATTIDPRGPMNIENLRMATEVHASVDCVAWDDGAFAGPDALCAFERFTAETAAELALVEELLLYEGATQELHNTDAIHRVLASAIDIPLGRDRDRTLIARRALARRIADGLDSGGPEEALLRARSHRARMRLHREDKAIPEGAPIPADSGDMRETASFASHRSSRTSIEADIYK